MKRSYRTYLDTGLGRLHEQPLSRAEVAAWLRRYRHNSFFLVPRWPDVSRAYCMSTGFLEAEVIVVDSP